MNAHHLISLLLFFNRPCPRCGGAPKGGPLPVCKCLDKRFHFEPANYPDFLMSLVLLGTACVGIVGALLIVNSILK